jgi:hypothetical protein
VCRFDSGEKEPICGHYAKSQVKVRTLVTKHCLQKSWSEEKEKWFAAIYSEAYDSGLCFTTKNRLDYSTQMRDTVDEFVRETGMKEDDTKKLRGTLLKAEKKFRRRFPSFFPPLLSWSVFFRPLGIPGITLTSSLVKFKRNQNFLIFPLFPLLFLFLVLFLPFDFLSLSPGPSSAPYPYPLS